MKRKWQEYFKDVLNIKREEVQRDESYLGADLPVDDTTMKNTLEAIN